MKYFLVVNKDQKQIMKLQMLQRAVVDVNEEMELEGLPHITTVALMHQNAEGDYVTEVEVVEKEEYIKRVTLMHDAIAAAEKEHMGDPDLQTGIYHPDAIAASRNNGAVRVPSGVEELKETAFNVMHSFKPKGGDIIE